ncbi:MAG TPA: hypothetical protein VK324_03620, partial [Tepidisphaeraceae bacterium]|nr:hypothetical protein [Tepidisphaeraceae bacterium]
MSPLLFLYASIALTLLAWSHAGVRRRRERRRLGALAASLGMTYCPGDPLRVADRVAGRIPFPGAAGVRVSDLFYGTAGGTRRYV